MPHIHCISVSKEVSDALDKMRHGEKSAVSDAALRAYLSLHDGAETEAKPRLKRYPAEEITVDQL